MHGHREAEMGLSRLLDGEAAAFLSVFIIHSWTERRGCCVLLNKEMESLSKVAGLFVLYTAEQGSALSACVL